MLNRQPGDRTLPTLITLLVLGVLLMTFDVRSEGGGVTGVLRSGTQTIVTPLQKAAAFVVNPIIDTVDSVTHIATLRETNLELERQVAQLQADLIAVNDDLARLELYEQLYDLELTTSAIGRTVAQVIGRPDPLSAALRIDKGTSSGIAVGQPVIDTSGYVVGSIQQATSGSALVVPITVGRDGVAVTVADETGVALPLVNNFQMRLEITDARQPILVGERVVTSSDSVRFPAGYPVGQVTEDAAPRNDGSLVTSLEPYADLQNLRVVVVLAWPPDPVAAIAPPSTTTTTSTSVPADGSSTTSTSTTSGDG